MEVAQGFTPPQNQTAVSSMVVIAGINRPVLNTVIRANNFGGGTSVNHLIYIDNAQRTVIKENQFISVNVAEVYFTANAKYNILGRDNTTIGSISNPRTRTLFKENTVDLGVGNIGVLQAISKLNLQNNWVGGGGFYKDESGVIRFLTSFNAGSPGAGTLIGTLPLGFRPYDWRAHGVSSGAGFGIVTISSGGAITINSLASNSDLYIPPFQGAINEL